MLISLAVDYRHADVATRERYHLTDPRLDTLARETAGRPGGSAVGIATCNRSELIAWVPGANAHTLEPHFRLLARRWMGPASAARELLGLARRRTGEATVRHLFRVAAGIESQVLGDNQILGQLKDAHLRAGARGGRGGVVHRLFERALHVGKRVRHETALSSGRYSVGAEAANVAARRFGSLAHARIAVLGCGKTGERVARQLAKLGARDLVLVNRTLAKAQRLAAAVRGRAVTLDALYGELALADIVIVATGAVTPLVYADPLASSRERCATGAHPLLIFDLSVPRNVDPRVAELPNVVIVDVDELRPVVTAGEREREASIPAAERIVEEEVRDFLEWVHVGEAREAIRPLRETLEALVRREVDFAAGDAALAQRAAQRVVAKLLAQPMVEMRVAAARGESLEDLTAALTRLWAPALTGRPVLHVASGPIPVPMQAARRRPS